MKLLACNSNKTLAKEISKYLGIDLVDAEVKKFADMEVYVDIKENVRGEDIFVIQSTSFPANLIESIRSKLLPSTTSSNAVFSKTVVGITESIFTASFPNALSDLIAMVNGLG